VDNLWTTGAPGDPGSVVKRQTPKLPRRIPLFWDFVISAVAPAGRARVSAFTELWRKSAIYFLLTDARSPGILDKPDVTGRKRR